MGSVICVGSFLAALMLIYTVRQPEGYMHLEEEISESETIAEEESAVIPWTQAFQFGTSFWYLMMIIITMYGSIVPFFHVCTDCILVVTRLSTKVVS
jgi:hypothetical protein